MGCNFSYEFLDIVNELNTSTDDVSINEIYGSTDEHSYLVARPKFRLPDICRNDFENYVKKAMNLGVSYNYTLNSNFIGSKVEIQKKEKDIKQYIKYLCDIGVSTITISLPILAEFIRDVDKNIGIEISTIAHIDTLTQIKMWKEKYNISKACGNVMKNREVKFLTNAAAFCSENDIVLTLIANEFCGNGIDENFYPATHCIYRDHCYQLHSVDYSYEESSLLNGYPMSRCMESRNSNITWLKMYYIRPEDMELYNSININHFKITGRTGSIEYMAKVLRAYVQKNWQGNLLGLWKHLETIGKSDDVNYNPKKFIDNKRLDGFLEFWFNNTDHICAYEVCGVTCSYCNDFYNLKVLT